MEQDSSIYQFKITLEYCKPPIWRKIQVPKNYTFHEFHQTLLDVMGWNGSHLHKFFPGGRNSSLEIGEPYHGMEIFGEFIDEKKIRLDEYFKAQGDIIKYEYDFGDGWLHKIVLEKVLPAKSGKNYPVCISGKRACPPEDCGGVGGYYELIEIMADPNHPEHSERKEWLTECGYENWDPAKFEIPML